MNTFALALLAAVGSATSALDKAPFTMAEYYRNYGGHQVDYTKRHNTGYGHAYPADNYDYYEPEQYSEPVEQPTPEPEYFHDPHHADSPYISDVPTGDFWNQVDYFNEWEEIYDQEDYEERLHTEATLMIALEAMRDSLIHLDHQIDDLVDCISENDSDIDDNHYAIHDNEKGHPGIERNDDEIYHQQHRIHELQDRCRDCQRRQDIDRDFLVLHCQQFAFAKDMVGACADILTCSDTRLHYRADIWHGNPYYADHDHHYYDETHYEPHYSHDDHHDDYYEPHYDDHYYEPHHDDVVYYEPHHDDVYYGPHHEDVYYEHGYHPHH